MFLSPIWAKICQMMPDTMYLQWQFHHIYGRWLNIQHPQTYADKLAYLKIYKKDERLSQLVDKFEVRKYVAEKIGEEYLIPLLGVYEKPEEINWNELPEQYVLKCTHDSASVILHINNDFDKEKAIISLNRHLARNLFYYSREYPYKKVIPRIICETFLSDKGNPPKDYKFFCFDGVPHLIQCDSDRFSGHHKNFYSLEWELLDLHDPDCRYHENHDERPQELDKMIKLARLMSQGFPHVRVDFYNLDGKIYFGEMTFFPWGGPIWFKPDSWNYKLGDLIKME